MLKIIFSFTLLLPLILVSCKKSETKPVDSEFPSAAETKPQYNNTTFGVYKGVIIGSVGTIV